MLCCGHSDVFVLVHPCPMPITPAKGPLASSDVDYDDCNGYTTDDIKADEQVKFSDSDDGLEAKDTAWLRDLNVEFSLTRTRRWTMGL